MSETITINGKQYPAQDIFLRSETGILRPINTLQQQETDAIEAKDKNGHTVRKGDYVWVYSLCSYPGKAADRPVNTLAIVQEIKRYKTETTLHCVPFCDKDASGYQGIVLREGDDFATMDNETRYHIEVKQTGYVSMRAPSPQAAQQYMDANRSNLQSTVEWIGGIKTVEVAEWREDWDDL